MNIEYKNTCMVVNNYACLTSKYNKTNVSKMELKDRIKLARKHAKLTQPQLAEKLNGLMSQQNISLLECGTVKGTEYIVQIAIACGVKPEWLATGNGDMINNHYELSQQLQTHLKVLQQLPQYAIDEVVRDAIKTAELIEHAKNDRNGTQ